MQGDSDLVSHSFSGVLLYVRSMLRYGERSPHLAPRRAGVGPAGSDVSVTLAKRFCEAGVLNVIQRLGGRPPAHTRIYGRAHRFSDNIGSIGLIR
ncbi:hypothetical protein BV20DRAFT_503362 [Pilatotrama ljubarskyi]|nr:hypothetical protein BV20DRAFT_503362 [Pilatotrama ljubarskyi]